MKPIVSALALLVLLLLIGERAEAHKPITSKYNYNQDVFPIINERCGKCHFSGGPAPMSLLTYKEAFPWAEAMRIELLAAHMPPWYAAADYGEVKAPPKLSARELDTLLTWATGGTPEGPAKRLIAAPIQSSWKMGKPDLVLAMPAEVTLDAGKMEDTLEFILQSGAAVDRRVKAVDLLPGAPAIVRNATIFTRSAGGKETTVLSLWLPGEDPIATPPAAAFLWRAGDDLVLRIHYRKTWMYEGKAVTDRSAVGVYFDRTAKQEIHSIAASRSAALDRDVETLAIRVVGGEADQFVSVEAVRPDGARTRLIQLLARPDWERRYWFSRPILLPRGTRISVTGNSEPQVWLDVLE